MEIEVNIYHQSTSSLKLIGKALQ